MAELSFARQYLSALDTRPLRLASDHVADPRRFPSQSPFILPKMPTAKRRRTDADGAASSSSAQPSSTSSSSNDGRSSLTVTLKALKSTPLVLAAQPPTTSAFELKTAFAAHFHVAVEKVRLLKDKKPVQDSKILKELVVPGEDGAAPREVEFSIVLLPGATLAAPKAAAAAAVGTPAAEVPEPVNEAGEVESKEALRGSGKGELESERFWEDLRGFLIQRLRDEKEGARVAGLFKDAYSKGS